MQTITPFIWLEGRAEEAANFYVSLFPRSKIVTVARWGEGGPAPKGSVMSVTVELDGRELIVFNGGPDLKLTPAFSLMVGCDSQAEIDRLWDALCEGGEPS